MPKAPNVMSIFRQPTSTAMSSTTPLVPTNCPKLVTKYSYPLIWAMREEGIQLVFTSTRGATMPAEATAIMARPR